MESKRIFSIIERDKLVGKPYSPQGFGPDHFFCFGLMVYLAQEMGLHLPRIEDHGEENIVAFIDNYGHYSDEVDYKDRQPGDILVFRGMNIQESSKLHFAMLVTRNTFIQCTENGVSLVSFLGRAYKDRLLTVCRLKAKGATP